MLRLIKSRNKAYRYIPYCVPSWGWAEHFAILKSLIFGHIVTGPPIQRLYSTVRSITGVPFVFGFDSGASAIKACLIASGIGQGHQVIMPSFCCHSVANAITSTGAVPCFCDIGNDLNPDVNSILSLLKPSVKAIVFPHLFGRPGKIQYLEEELERIGVRHDLLLIDDAAQSFGARIHDRWLGTFGDAGIISFGPGKMTTASGGGLLLSRSKKIAQEIEKLDIEPPSLADKLRDLVYWTIFRRWRRYSILAFRFVGSLFRKAADSNSSLYKLSAIDASIALPQLNRIEKLIKQRYMVRQRLDQLLAEIQQDYNFSIEPLEPISVGINETHTKYIFFYDEKNNATDRNNLQQFYEFFRSVGIELQPLYTLLHHCPDFGKSACSLKLSEKRVMKTLNLCTDPSLSKKDIEHICQSLKKYFLPIQTNF